MHRDRSRAARRDAAARSGRRSPCGRASSSINAASRVHSALARSRGAPIGGIELRAIDRRPAIRAGVRRRSTRLRSTSAQLATAARPVRDSSASQPRHACSRATSPRVRNPALTSASCSSSASRGSGHASARTVAIADASSTPSAIGVLVVARSARLDRVRPPLLERRVVQERIRPRVDDLVRERRRLRRIARDAA